MIRGFYSTEWARISLQRHPKILKAVLLSTYGSAYPSHFGNASRNQIMKQFVTSKVVHKINDKASCFLIYYSFASS